jgi:hypothetical protein
MFQTKPADEIELQRVRVDGKSVWKCEGGPCIGVRARRKNCERVIPRNTDNNKGEPYISHTRLSLGCLQPQWRASRTFRTRPELSPNPTNPRCYGRGTSKRGGCG